MNAPYRFTGAYSGVFRQGINCMDARHIYTVHELLVAGRFRNALEIGTADGACTTAFVESLRHTEGTVTTCDLFLTESSLAVCESACDRSRITQLRQSSVEVLHRPEEFDFVMVDGDHSSGAVRQELLQLSRRRPRCVMAHDTSASENGFRNCEGARELREFFQNISGYQSWSEDLRREGELTHRGLFFATSDRELFDRSIDILLKWGGLEGAWLAQNVVA